MFNKSMPDDATRDDFDGSFRGRPRDPATDKAILEAAFELLAERGVQGMTMQAVAKRAGVARATLYRRWSSASDLALSSLLRHASRAVPIPDSGSLDSDMRTLLNAAFLDLRGPTGHLLRSLMADAQRDAALATEFYQRFLVSRRNVLKILLNRAVARGELPADVNQEFLADLVYGIMWYRLLVRHAPLDGTLVTELLDALKRYKK